MYVNNQISAMIGLALFIFVVEKIFAESGKASMAYIINLAGFIAMMLVLVKMMNGLINTARMYFPI